MGCVCCSVGSFVSILLDAIERVSLCTVCAALTCCLMLTIITVLIMGVGIGYNYCFVTNQVESMANAAKAAGAAGVGGRRSDTGRSEVMRTVDKAMRRGLSHRVSRRDAETNSTFTLNNIANTSLIKNLTVVLYNVVLHFESQIIKLYIEQIIVFYLYINE